jgi:hypothetical protein
VAELILTTFEWVPELPRGYVRDLRVRWALERAGLPWSIFKFSNDASETAGAQHLFAFLKARLTHLEAAVVGRAWLAGSFSIADIAMVDVAPCVREGTRRPDGVFAAVDKPST